MADDDIFMIPCEICNDAINSDIYEDHIIQCNQQHLQNLQNLQANVLNSVYNIFQHLNPQPIEIDSEEEEADAELAYADELEDDAVVPNIAVNQPNINIIPIPQPNEALGGIPFHLHDLFNVLRNIVQQQPHQNIVQPGGNINFDNLEDVVVALSDAKYAACLTKVCTEDAPITCNICCMDNVTEYMKINCGHTMCESCSKTWFSRNVKCPFCNQDLRDLPEHHI